MRFWAVGGTVSETAYDAGLRRAQTDEARAAHEASVAAYRQTVLAAFQAVEDNLAALRILVEEEARVQDDAVKFAQEAVAVITNQYIRPRSSTNAPRSRSLGAGWSTPCCSSRRSAAAGAAPTFPPPSR
jgi:outer membrane protein TolC